MRKTKETWKIWTILWAFMLLAAWGLLVYAASSVWNFANYKTDNLSDWKLTAEAWNQLMDSLDGSYTSVSSTSSIPDGAIMMFGSYECPEWWWEYWPANGALVVGAWWNLNWWSANIEYTGSHYTYNTNYITLKYCIKWSNVAPLSTCPHMLPDGTCTFDSSTEFDLYLVDWLNIGEFEALGSSMIGGWFTRANPAPAQWATIDLRNSPEQVSQSDGKYVYLMGRVCNDDMITYTKINDKWYKVWFECTHFDSHPEYSQMEGYMALLTSLECVGCADEWCGGCGSTNNQQPVDNWSQQGIPSWWSSFWCFLPWTKVSTIDGDKNIEEIVVWDFVLWYNEAIKQNEYNKVVETFVHENNDNDLYEIITDGDVLKVTNIHPFYVVRQWIDNYGRIEAQDLEVWDKLLMKDGNYKSIKMIYHYPYVWTVYNLEVENTHNYFVGEWYLVHNKQQAELEKDDGDIVGDSNNDWYCAWDNWVPVRCDEWR